MTKKIITNGIVVSGNKKGQYFINLPWVKKQILEKLGFDPYIGTLNLKIKNERDIIDLYNENAITIEPEKGYYQGKCFKALLMKKTNCAVILPNVPDYPSDLLELIAPINLRKTLGLIDGMKMELIILFD